MKKLIQTTVMIALAILMAMPFVAIAQVEASASLAPTLIPFHQTTTITRPPDAANRSFFYFSINLAHPSRVDFEITNVAGTDTRIYLVGEDTPIWRGNIGGLTRHFIDLDPGLHTFRREWRTAASTSFDIRAGFLEANRVGLLSSANNHETRAHRLSLGQPYRIFFSHQRAHVSHYTFTLTQPGRPIFYFSVDYCPLTNDNQTRTVGAGGRNNAPTIRLFDVNGSHIRQVHTPDPRTDVRNPNPRVDLVPMGQPDLAAGTYFIRIEHWGRAGTNKIMVTLPDMPVTPVAPAPVPTPTPAPVTPVPMPTPDVQLPQPAAGRNFATVASEDGIVLAIRNDGSLWAWGSNDYGQLGDGTTQGRETPVQILENVVSVSTSWNTNIALQEDGILMKWGQIGWDFDNDRGIFWARPTRVLDDVVYAAVFYRTVTAIRSDGSLWFRWGLSDFVHIMDDVAHVVPTLNYFVIIRNDGTVFLHDGWDGYVQIIDNVRLP